MRLNALPLTLLILVKTPRAGKSVDADFSHADADVSEDMTLGTPSKLLLKAPRKRDRYISITPEIDGRRPSLLQAEEEGRLWNNRKALRARKRVYLTLVIPTKLKRDG